MAKPIIVIHDVESNQIIEREMNDDEYLAYAEGNEKAEKARLQKEAKENARKSALNKLIDLGLTEEEIAAL